MKKRRLTGEKFSSVTLTVIIFVFVCIWAIVALVANQNSRVMVTDCVNRDCSGSIVGALKSSSSHLVQDFDVVIKIKVQPQLLQNPNINMIPPTVSGLSQIAVVLGGEGRVIVHAPERYGASPYMLYISPHLSQLNSIRVRVVDGREIYLFINGDIAYTHRYQLPVFFSNPLELVQPALANSGYVSHIAVEKSQIYREKVNIQRVSYLGFILYGVFLSYLIGLLLSRRTSRDSSLLTKVRALPPISSTLILLFWLVCLIAWAVKPFDPTGANNPGLFGPTGPAFSDYFQISQISHFDKPYILGGVNYPPFALAIMKALSSLLPGLLGLATLVAICLGLLSFMFLKMKTNAIGKNWIRNALVFLVPYPLIFGIIRGNIDLLAASFVWLAILLKDTKHRIWPAIFLACAISIKIWPVVFLLLFLRWGKRRTAKLTVGIALFLTLCAPLLLGYRNLNDILHTSILGLSSAGATSTAAFHNTFSASSLLYIGHLLILDVHPLHPSTSEFARALSFTGGISAKALLMLLGIYLVRMIWKSTTFSKSYFYCACIALLIPSPAYTYRGVILIAYFYFFSREAPRESRFPEEPRKFPTASSERKENARFVLLEKVRNYMWLPILAPTTIHFVQKSEVSVASLLQPLALVMILAIDASMYLLEGRRS